MSAYSHWLGLAGTEAVDGGGQILRLGDRSLGLVGEDVDIITCILCEVYIVHTIRVYLAMLQSGSMRWTVGSSMYSKVRLSLIWAWSTLTLICTGPTPDREGAE